jgi:ubiquinone/menaquinone biosynthesis C-methylase UbiE
MTSNHEFPSDSSPSPSFSKPQAETATAASVERHYTRPHLENTILNALKNAGKNVDQLTVDDLAPIDELHPLGREATANLASLLITYNNLQPNFHVLDVGSGIGGPSRYLASRFGCHVTGLDLVGEYCRVADSLAKRVKLDNLLTYRQGDATHMPFEDATFDVVWTQYASMNIADKKRLYSEMHRVLKPDGGKLAVEEAYKGSSDMNDSSLYFPVPWAAGASISHLISAEEARRLLKEVIGFKEVVWEDKTQHVIDWIKQMMKRAQQTSGGGPPPLGIHVVVGPQWSEMVKNALKNVEEGRITVAQGIFERR